MTVSCIFKDRENISNVIHYNVLIWSVLLQCLEVILKKLKHKFDNNHFRFQRINLPFVGIKTDT
jgi:hypothetical protein